MKLEGGFTEGGIKPDSLGRWATHPVHIDVTLEKLFEDLEHELGHEMLER